MKTHTPSILDRSPSMASWPLLLLALGACQPGSPGLEETGETGSTSTDDSSSTSTGIDPEGTTGSSSSGIAPDGTTGSSSSGTDSGETTGTTTAETGSSGAGSNEDPPGAPVLALGLSPVKRFDFSWAAVADADYYQLLERPMAGEPFAKVGEDIVGESISMTVPLFARQQASYVLRACNAGGCTDSTPIDVMGSLAEAVGYFKASNTGVDDWFGFKLALSGDGNTLVVGAAQEDSGASGIDGDEADESVPDSGAVYVFVRDAAGEWSQQAYIKASNPDAQDAFGGGTGGASSLALSSDGNTLVVGAPGENSNAVGIDSYQANNLANNAGAVYVFVRDGIGQWSQQAYVKASNTGAGDGFGTSLSLSDDGNTLAVGAPQEDSAGTGIDGDQGNGAFTSGAVYVLVRDGIGQWSQQAYVKASNTDSGDFFGWSVALSGDGETLAVGALDEDSSATGIDGDQADDTAYGSGAVYVLVRDAMDQWSQQAYVKASNTGSADLFGAGVALSNDGDTLAVGAYGEESSATRIDGDQADDSAFNAGAVYVFVRDEIGQWSQHAYVKASNTELHDNFGESLALSGDGNTLAVGASEDSNATGIDGDQTDDSIIAAGAIYVFVRDPFGQWSQQAYVKAPSTNTLGFGDSFGLGVSLSDDGNTLAVGGYREDSSATGIGGNQNDELMEDAGAVFLY